MPLEFSIQVNDWVKKTQNRSRAAFQAIALDALNEVKKLTPVRTGYLRSNWAVIRNNDPVPLPGRVPDPETVISQIQLGDRIAIVNPVVYARRVEYGFVGKDSLGRYYDQKGRGMMQQTIAMLPEIAARAVARVQADQNSPSHTAPAA